MKRPLGYVLLETLVDLAAGLVLAVPVAVQLFATIMLQQLVRGEPHGFPDGVIALAREPLGPWELLGYSIVSFLLMAYGLYPMFKYVHNRRGGAYLAACLCAAVALTPGSPPAWLALTAWPFAVLMVLVFAYRHFKRPASTTFDTTLTGA